MIGVKKMISCFAYTAAFIVINLLLCILKLLQAAFWLMLYYLSVRECDSRDTEISHIALLLGGFPQHPSGGNMWEFCTPCGRKAMHQLMRQHRSHVWQYFFNLQIIGLWKTHPAFISSDLQNVVFFLSLRKVRSWLRNLSLFIHTYIFLSSLWPSSGDRWNTGNEPKSKNHLTSRRY